MGGIIMKCKEFQIGDWIQDENGSPMRIIKVGRDYACATFGDNECPWAFEDDDVQPEGIPLTKEMLDANGFRYEKEYGPFYRSILGSYHYMPKYCVCVECQETSKSRKICYIDCQNREYGKESSVTIRREFYVHTLQHALRIVGLSDIADNFKV